MNGTLLSEVVKDIKTGDLLAFRKRHYNGVIDFVLLAYQKLFRKTYSHVGIAIRDCSEKVYIIEALPPSVSKRPLSKLDDFYLIPVDMDIPNRYLVDYLDNKIDVKYNVWSMIGYWLGYKPDREKDLYCSELASEFYNHFGFLKERRSGRSPDAIVKAVKEKTGLEEEELIIVDKGNVR